MSDSPIQDVSDTAFMVAAYRAAESERSDAFFHDPLAARLAGERGRQIVAKVHRRRRALLSAWMMAVRTCVIDQYIDAAIAQGTEVIINLGAGLDTRPYRLELPPSLRWIEVDLPHVIEYKERTLSGEAPRCRLERVPLDLADSAARRRFLTDIAAYTAHALVLTEGVVPYLREEDVAALADDLRAHAAFRHWVADCYSPETARFRRRAEARGPMQNAPWRFQPADYFAFFATHGWTAREVRYVPEEAQRLGRPFPLGPVMRLAFRLWGLFMSRERRTAIAHAVGFVRFEPAPPR